MGTLSDTRLYLWQSSARPIHHHVSFDKSTSATSTTMSASTRALQQCPSSAKSGGFDSQIVAEKRPWRDEWRVALDFA